MYIGVNEFLIDNNLVNIVLYAVDIFLDLLFSVFPIFCGQRLVYFHHYPLNIPT